MRHSTETLRCLSDLDVAQALKLWPVQFPHFTGPNTEEEMLVMLHMARTQTERVAFNKRAYSHQWLTERNYPSQLPDNLKPKAQRLYPVVVGVVGISVNAPEHRAPLAAIIRESMEHSVLDSFANGDRDPELVKRRMLEARANVYKKLLGKGEK